MTVDDLCMGCMEPRAGATTCRACGYVEGTPPANPVHLPPRTLLRDHIVLGRVLGHGGFGIAYLAWDQDLEVKVAVKEFLPGDFATRSADGRVTPYGGESKGHFEYGLTSFLGEGRAVARFNDHPGIAPVIAFFRANGTGYLVMQYLEGMSFAEYLTLHGGRVPWDQAAAILMPVMDTLRVVHRAGMLHRDISPHNIYISKSRQVKLLDFGAARQALGDRSKSLSVILKAGYAPFEQYLSKGRQGPWTDIYALAATLYRAIVGEIPPEATSRVADDELEPPRSRGLAVSAMQESVLLRALAVDHKQRYQTVAELQKELLRVTPGLRPADDVDDLDDDEDADKGDRNKDHERQRDRDRDRERERDREKDDDDRDRSRDRDRDRDRGDVHPQPFDFAAVLAHVKKALRRAMDVAEAPTRMIADFVHKRTGLRRAPDDEAAFRTVALWGALITGTFGALFWCLPLLLLYTKMFFDAGGHLATGIVILRLLAGFVGAASFAIGGGAALTGDRRGASTVWAAGWFLLAANVAGATLQLATRLMTTELAYMSIEIRGEIDIFMRGQAATVLVLAGLWLRSTRQSSSAGQIRPGEGPTEPMRPTEHDHTGDATRG
jgi:serine/threonine protein kinase